jgi:hypothetical protein
LPMHYVKPSIVHLVGIVMMATVPYLVGKYIGIKFYYQIQQLDH